MDYLSAYIPAVSGKRRRARRPTRSARGISLLALAVILAAGTAVAADRRPDLRPASMNNGIPTVLIELDGTDSENPDGGNLSYEWTQIDGPKVELSDPAAAKPYFRTGKAGFYRFQLIVTSNGIKSKPCIVELMVERENQPPVAVAPANIQGEVGKLLEIDGGDSYDPEGENLTYRWRPLTQGLAIPSEALSKPVLSFEPTLDGVFEVELIVSDGQTVSQPTVVRVAVKPKPRPPVAKARVVARDIPVAPQPEMAMAPPAGARPVARIDAPVAAKVGEAVMLDARGSRGANGSRLDYLWRQKSGPFVNDFEIVFDGAAERFRAPREGDYEFELVVSDGSRDSDPIVHKIKILKEPEPPVAVVVAPTRAMPGALVKMDATQSYDLAGSPLIYRWRQTGGPRVTNYVIDEKIGDAAPAFHPPTSGIYSFELVVSNGKLQSKPLGIDIEVGDARRAPSLSIGGPEVANTGDRLTLTANIDMTEAANLSFVWRQVDGPAQALPPTNGPRVAVSPPAAGRYVFDLSAVENGKVVATARRSLEVFDAPNRLPASAARPESSAPTLTPTPAPVASSLPELTPLLDMPMHPAAPASVAPPPGAPRMATVPVTKGPDVKPLRPAAQIHPSTLQGGMYNFGDASPLEPLQPLP